MLIFAGLRRCWRGRLPQIFHAYSQEIPGQGQTAPSGLTLQLPLCLLCHPHLDSCCPVPAAYVETLLSGRGIEGDPFRRKTPLVFGVPPATQKLCSLLYKTE